MQQRDGEVILIRGESNFLARAGIEQIEFSDLITIVYSVRVARVPPIRPREFFPSKAIEPAPKTDDFSQRAVCCSAHSNFNLTAIDALVYRKAIRNSLLNQGHMRNQSHGASLTHDILEDLQDLIQGAGVVTCSPEM